MPARSEAGQGAMVTTSVVMIEDSKDICALIEDLLRHIGQFRVVARIATEAEGTEWLRRNEEAWDLAIVDLVLREGSGFNLIGRCRQANERARILVLSDYPTPSIRVRCVELGADAVFAKGEIKAFTSYLSRVGPSRNGFGALAAG